MDDGFDQDFWDSLLRGDHLEDFLKHAAPSGKPPVSAEVFAQWQQASKEAADHVREHFNPAPTDSSS